MATYWVYLNDEVSGPYTVEQMIRLRGFSRQTQVCQEDGSGRPSAWISPAQIPELSRIFEKADQRMEAPSRPPPRPAPKPVPPVRRAPMVAPEPAAAPISKPNRLWQWIALAALSALLVAGGVMFYRSYSEQQNVRSRQTVSDFIELHSLPAESAYATLRQYIEAKHLHPRWDVERTPAGPFNATLSWSDMATTPPVAAAVYAFEANLDAQIIRGLNTAAQKLLAEGFPRASSPKPAASSEEAKKPAAPSFQSALDKRRHSIEKGDFSAVWNFFSDRRRNQMLGAGISEAGFIRLQALTRGLEANVTQTVVKSKDDGEDRRLVLLRQTQANHPDMFLKQTWVKEDSSWKMDDEEKRSAEPAANTAPAAPAKPSESSAASTPPLPSAPATPSPAGAEKPSPQQILSLPGLSTDAQH
jgi:hypothetical protein